MGHHAPCPYCNREFHVCNDGRKLHAHWPCGVTYVNEPYDVIREWEETNILYRLRSIRARRRMRWEEAS